MIHHFKTTHDFFPGGGNIIHQVDLIVNSQAQRTSLMPQPTLKTGFSNGMMTQQKTPQSSPSKDGASNINSDLPDWLLQHQQGMHQPTTAQHMNGANNNTSDNFIQNVLEDQNTTRQLLFFNKLFPHFSESTLRSIISQGDGNFVNTSEMMLALENARLASATPNPPYMMGPIQPPPPGCKSPTPPDPQLLARRDSGFVDEADDNSYGNATYQSMVSGGSNSKAKSNGHAQQHMFDNWMSPTGRRTPYTSHGFKSPRCHREAATCESNRCANRQTREILQNSIKSIHQITHCINTGRGDRALNELRVCELQLQAAELTCNQEYAESQHGVSGCSGCCNSQQQHFHPQSCPVSYQMPQHCMASQASRIQGSSSTNSSATT